jgi:hemerythrin superfamily protein
MAQAMERGGGSDAIDLILEDHRRVDELFDRFEALTDTVDSAEKRELATQMLRELSVHASIEEQIFYPAVRERLPQGDEIVGESLDEHRAVKELLAAIEDTEPADPKFDERVTMLIREVRHHVDEEETVILPGLRQQLGHEFLLDLGGRLQEARAGAPTHPHPLAPDSGPMKTPGDVAMGLVDRAKDEIVRED